MSKRQSTNIIKISRYEHAATFTLKPMAKSILCVRNVPKVSSNIQVSFQLVTENKGLLVEGGSWGLQQTTAGGKP